MRLRHANQRYWAKVIEMPLKPLIGLTCHTVDGPIPRSCVSQSYVDAIVDAGGAPLAIPIGLDLDALATIYGVLNGLLLPGGDDLAPDRYGQEPHPMLGLVDPARDNLELIVSRWALRDDMPILGICRGIQVLAVAAGGSLYQDLPAQLEACMPHDVRAHGRDHLCHDIQITPDTKLARAIGTGRTRVNSFHHQAVLEVPKGFIVSARSEDGVIEGIESTSNRYVVGVQCHPEGMWRTTAPSFRALFAGFVDTAAGYTKTPRIEQRQTA